MANSKHQNFGVGTPRHFSSPLLDSLPLAWNWCFRKIDDRSLREFAKYIHGLIECEDDQSAVALLKELVEKARYE